MPMYPLSMFSDGACPICDRAIALMARPDRQRRLSFCEFASPDFDERSPDWLSQNRD